MHVFSHRFWNDEPKSGHRIEISLIHIEKIAIKVNLIIIIFIGKSSVNIEKIENRIDNSEQIKLAFYFYFITQVNETLGVVGTLHLRRDSYFHCK